MGNGLTYYLQSCRARANKTCIQVRLTNRQVTHPIPEKDWAVNHNFLQKKLLHKAKNTGHLEWNALGDFSEFKTNGDSKEAL